MNITSILNLFQSSFELGLISSLVVLALFLSYSMLNVCDLSTDGCYILGAAVGTVVAMNGHPYLAIIAAMSAGIVSGFVTAFLQTKMGVDSLLAGIVVNTGLYSVNMWVMGNRANLNLFKVRTVFTDAKYILKGTFLEKQYGLIVIAVAVLLVIAFLSFFLKTKLGLSIRATGNNPSMVRASSVNPAFTTVVGLCIANAFTALSGCLYAQMQKSLDIKDGTGMVTIALASLLIGGTIIKAGKRIPFRLLGAVLGSVIFRLVYAVALKFNMPSYMLKAVSSVIVIIAISGPYLKSRYPEFHRRITAKIGKGGKGNNA